MRHIISIFGLSVSFLMAIYLGCNNGVNGKKETNDSSDGWSASLNGNHLEIAYGSGGGLPQYAVLDLNSSYFRMTYNSDAGWGTSIVLSPSFWTDGTYHQGSHVDANWEINGSDFVISIWGTVSELQFQGEIIMAPPYENTLTASVTIEAQGNINLDERPGEAFKPLMLSSMHISEDVWDAQTAYVDSQSYAIPVSGWIINPPDTGSKFGLVGGTSDWKVDSPTIEVLLNKNMIITGWVEPSNDPNDDNVGYWASSDEMLTEWSYSIYAMP
jgi:hypothetical protein